jgi:hypothetical protein
MAGYNLSCIVTLPIYQRKGYGFFLISFSYLLSQREHRLGSPEKPLSDLGLLSYRSYWKTALANAILEILDASVGISVKELGIRTGMTDDDVVSGLEGLDALVRDPQSGVYAIRVNREKLVERVEMVEKKGYVKVKKDLLKWTPYLLGRREAKELLEGGLEELIARRISVSTTLEDFSTEEAGTEEEIAGKDIPTDRFVSVAVRNLIQPPRITYDSAEPSTPIPPETPATPLLNDSSPSPAEPEEPEEPEEDIISDEPIVSAASSPSVIASSISDEPYSADEPSDEEEMSDYLSDDSNEFNPRKRRRLNRSSQQRTMTPEVVVRLKSVAKAPRGGGDMMERRPKVISAKAPRSRAGRNPPEVMARRTSGRRG